MWFVLDYCRFATPTPDGRIDAVTLYRSTPHGPTSIGLPDANELPETLRLWGEPEEYPGSLCCACCGVTIVGEHMPLGAAVTSATLCHAMDVSVRKLRNHTGEVIAAVEAGEVVVLTVHGKPVADIVPRHTRAERRSSQRLVAELAEVAAMADELGVTGDASDYDTGLTTDDMVK